MSFTEHAIKAIHDAGGRMTEQRRLIVELLSKHHDMIDADTLLTLAQEEDTGISRATVYRTLNTLADADLLKRRYLSLDHERFVFELPEARTDYILTCRTCHTTMPFQSEILDNLQSELATQYGFESVRVCVCAEGICQSCHAKQKE